MFAKWEETFFSECDASLFGIICNQNQIGDDFWSFQTSNRTKIGNNCQRKHIEDKWNLQNNEKGFEILRVFVEKRATLNASLLEFWRQIF